VLIVTGLVMLALEIGSDGLGYLEGQYANLVQEALWAPLRNGLVFLVAGAALFALGLAVAPRRGTADAPETHEQISP
jgi:hypothetical protein